MTTAVASPPSFQPISRLGWNAASPNAGTFASMSADDVSRMLMPQKKSLQRTNSSSSLASSASTSSTSSTSTVQTAATSNGDPPPQAAKKKARGGFWPAKSEPTAAISNGKANGATSVTSQQIAPAPPSQASQLNGARPLGGPPTMEQTAVLALLPMNGTFERKQINVPFFPDVLRVGRQTNAKTVPTASNGFFDSKVLSRQHAELWAERNGKVWIRDVKSSNGTFVNGQRLSAENQNSDPHELRQHDTLELGIDIVSEDQKTIVHHKVSAKVEFVGLPGNSNNVMDLNFGDLDPSHGGALLPSPMSAPMAHSRSRPSGALGSLRPSPASSVVGGGFPSVAQQRQLNFWGAPLNIEQLVKTLSTEMKAARYQSQDLDSASTLLNSILLPDGSQEKSNVESKDTNQHRQSNGKPRSLRLDSASRFAEPPAPPPQQPLPEKPDAPRSATTEPSTFSFLKRSDTAKPPTGTNAPLSSPQNSQILSLVEALSIAKKELDSQGAKVQQLEDMLRQERSARESAEEKARRLEQHYDARPTMKIEDQETAVGDEDLSTISVAMEGEISGARDDGNVLTLEDNVQERLDSLVSEIQRMKAEMERFQQRAETAEGDASKARLTLSQMIDKLRKENGVGAFDDEQMKSAETSAASSSSKDVDFEDVSSVMTTIKPKRPPDQANGHVRAPSRLPHQLERAVATMLRDSNGGSETLAQSAPYVSMLGVVLIGVGLMAYLNSWQKNER